MAEIVKRVSPTTKKTTYQVRIRRTGYPAIVKSFKTKTLADDWARQEEANLLKGLPVLTKKASQFTFADAIADYKQVHSDCDDSKLSRLGQIEADMSELAIVNLSASKFSAYIKTWQNTEIPAPKHKKKDHPLYKQEKRFYSNSTVRKIYYTVKTLVEWHSRYKNYPFDPNVFKTVTPPADGESRSRRFEGDEEMRLFDACLKNYENKQEMQAIISFALETAMRLGEISKIRWEDVDFKNKQINLKKEIVKTKKSRSVPMTSVCLKLLQDHMKTQSDTDSRVFWQWKDSHAVYQRVKVVFKNAGIEKMTFHDFRHEATSRLFERTNLRDIQIAMITGHSDLRTLARYANLRANDMVVHLW